MLNSCQILILQTKVSCVSSIDSVGDEPYAPEKTRSTVALCRVGGGD